MSTEAKAPSPSPEPPLRLRISDRVITRCQSDDDGECEWYGCPQLRDGEPSRSSRHCPLDREDDSEPRAGSGEPLGPDPRNEYDEWCEKQRDAQAASSVSPGTGPAGDTEAPSSDAVEELLRRADDVGNGHALAPVVHGLAAAVRSLRQERDALMVCKCGSNAGPRLCFACDPLTERAAAAALRNLREKADGLYKHMKHETSHEEGWNDAIETILSLIDSTLIALEVEPIDASLRSAAPEGTPAVNALLTPEIVAKLQSECDRVAALPDAAELAKEARAALSKIAPPTPESTNPLYYPLLFLIEAVEAHERWLAE